MFKKENLKHHSNYKIGGTASHFFAFRTVNEAKQALTEVQKLKKPFVVVGSATNILFGDNGWDGVILKNQISTFEVHDTTFHVGAGVLVSRVLESAIEKGLSGLEWAGGLPGTVGGAIRGNAGAFGGETKDSVVDVTSVRISGGKPEIVRRTNKECEFEYRSSIFKTKCRDEIILEATFQLKPGDRNEISKAINEKIAYRKERQPLEYPNIGSMFKNVDAGKVPAEFRIKVAGVIKQDPFPIIPAAFLISEAGLKGMHHGGATISPKHPNFIVNTGNATASDVRHLIALVKKTVKEKFNIDLEEEIVYIGE